MIIKKAFNFWSILINVVGLIFVFWIFGYVSKTNSWGIFETITFIATVSTISFIHLFFIPGIKNKIRSGLLDFFPFLVFSFLSSNGEPLTVFFITLLFFLCLLVAIVLINSLFVFLWRKMRK